MSGPHDGPPDGPDDRPGEGPTDRADEEPLDVGSPGEEAVKLFGALADWARDHGGEVAQGLSGLGAHAAAAAGEVNDHLATGAEECRWCPVCRTVHALRGASPEVRAHLATAMSALAQAAAAMLATPPRSSRGDTGVEHIDLDDDPEEWPEEPT